MERLKASLRCRFSLPLTVLANDFVLGPLSAICLSCFFELAIFRLSLFFRFLSTHNEPARARSRYFDCIYANICRNAMQECYQSAKISYAALPVCFVCQSTNNGADYVA
ncbi:MAG: hypothetical protein ACRDCK_07835 [Plesiomonas shigelloides]